MQSLDEVVMSTVTTDLLFSFSIMCCYKFNASKLHYDSGASVLCCWSESRNTEM